LYAQDRVECLDANVVQDLMAGALDSVTRGAVLGHLDTCEECRELLAVSARDSVNENLRDTAPGGPALIDPLAQTRGSDGRGHDEDEALAATVTPDDLKALESKPRVVSGARPAIGQKLGRYHLLDKLGAGAMGVVWLAEDPELGRKVALKLLKRPDASLTERLVREARSMAQVNDPNVVAVYDVGTADGSTYIAMELVQGKSLRQWQASQTSRTVPEIIEAYVAAGRGLAAAHRAGLVHRDFKPDNVLVGDDGRVRVTDFGLAAAKAGESGHAHLIGDVNLTTSGSVLGTPAYMGPEQFKGGNVDSRTDQFNFCVSLYEALYGERPFEGKTFEELGNNVCAGKMRVHNERVPVSAALLAILRRGMSVQPGDRYPTMDHLLAELGRDRARPWRLTAAISAVVAVALLFGLGADYVIRSRGTAASRQAFAATGAQITRAVETQAKRFQAASVLVDELPQMYVLTSQHDESDFGIGNSAADDQAMREVHDVLQSASWGFVRELGPGEIVVADRKARIVYSSAAPTDWQGKLDPVPAIARALKGEPELLATVHYDDPAFVAAKVFGATPRRGLALMFVRAIERNGQLGGLFLQFVDAKEVLGAIRLDDETQLALVGLDGASAGMPDELARAAPRDGTIGEASSGGKTYEVQSRLWADAQGQPVASVVMARPVAGVLSLFPYARAVFAGAAILALLLAMGTFGRARAITGARV
jgi:predicted Ser/Thr protein kinase